MVDDSHLVNRQFVQREIDTQLGIKLRDKGFNFFMSKDERRTVVDRLRPELESLAAQLRR